MTKQVTIEIGGKSPKTERLTIKKQGLDMEAALLLGQEEGEDNTIYVAFCPSIMVTGYGTTEKEAMTDLTAAVQLFHEDLMRLTPEKQLEYLASLGWKPTTFYQKKKFSKAYVDASGELKGIQGIKSKSLSLAHA